MKYEVVVSIYEKGKDESVIEETVFETDDLVEAQEEFDDLTVDYAEDEEEAAEEAEEEETA